MGLTAWSISVRRRIRDAIARISPKNIIHTGASIGHLTAWILDHYEGKDDLENFQIIEEKPICGDSNPSLSEIFFSSNKHQVGSPSLLTVNSRPEDIQRGDSPMLESAEAIIVDAPMDRLAEDITAMLPLLTNNGVLLVLNRHLL